LTRIAARTPEMGTIEKGRVEGLSQPDRRQPRSCVGGPLVKKRRAEVMSPVLRSASPRAKSAAISAAGNRGFTDGSVGAGIAAAETVAAADAALATGAAFAAAMVGAGSFDDVAGAALALVEIVRLVELSIAGPRPSEAAVGRS
jgi:hypothetical protein